MKIINKKCKVCPIGCNLQITINENEISVDGNKCNRGKEYAINEVLQPSRIITSRVLLENGPMSRLPVKTIGVIPSDLVDDCMELIKITKVSAPISKGDIIIENILDIGVDLIAARRVNRL